MLNIFKKFLRDGQLGNRTARRSHRRRSQTGKQTTESLETRSLLTASLVNFLTTEHVDINLQRTGSEWSLGPRESDSNPAIQYANDQAVLYAGS